MSAHKKLRVKYDKEVDDVASDIEELIPVRDERLKSLLDMSAIKVVINLFMQTKIPDCILHCYNTENCINKYLVIIPEQLEKVITEQIKSLFIPKSLYPLLLNFSKTTARELLIWFRLFYNSIKYISKINTAYHTAWTAEGRIDIAATVENVIAKGELNSEDKFHLACKFCLENTIQTLVPEILQVGRLQFAPYDHPMTYYWISTLDLNGMKLRDWLFYFIKIDDQNKSSLNEVIFKSLLKDPMNPVAAKFMWDKLSNSERGKLTPEVLASSYHVDLKNHVQSQLNCEEQKATDALASTKGKFNSIFRCHSYWTDSFQLLKNILQKDRVCQSEFLLGLQNFLSEGVDRCLLGRYVNMEEYTECTTVFKKAWNLAPGRMRNVFFVNPATAHLMFDLLAKFVWSESYDLVCLIMNDCPVVLRKRFLLSNDGFLQFCTLMRGNKWDLISKYIALGCLSTEDITKLKRDFFYRFDFCAIVEKHLAMKSHWCLFDKFLNWACKSHDEIKEFKMELFSDCSGTYDINPDNVAILGHSCYIKFQSVSKLNDSHIDFIKALHQFSIRNILWDLIRWHKYEEADEILNWWFSNDPTRIHDYKRNSLASDLPTCLAKYGSCFNDHCYQCVDRFVHWCFDGVDEEMKEFKNQLMVVEGISEAVFEHVRGAPEFIELFKWFDPTVETALKFKSILLSKWSQNSDVVLLFEDLLMELMKKENGVMCNYW